MSDRPSTGGLSAPIPLRGLTGDSAFATCAIRQLQKQPLHDWASHAADAFRTAAVMIREPERRKEQEKRRPAGKLSPWS